MNEKPYKEHFDSLIRNKIGVVIGVRIGVLFVGIVLIIIGINLISNVSTMTECSSTLSNPYLCDDFEPEPKSLLELFSDLLWPYMMLILGLFATLAILIFSFKQLFYRRGAKEKSLQISEKEYESEKKLQYKYARDVRIARNRVNYGLDRVREEKERNREEENMDSDG